MFAFEFEGNVKNGFIELPEEYKNKVNTIVKVIVMQDNPIAKKKSKKSDKKRQFGCGKGIFTFIADDFDDELEMFKEYSK
ncbi:MAG: DUF2281 domain-containing protein [Cyanobacteriota bacterium]